MEPISSPASDDAPRGTQQARCDDKGRLKLPSVLHQYLKERGEKKLFVTTLDERTARMYPISSWKETEKLLSEPGEDAEFAESVKFIARHYGDDSEIDEQGRLLVPKELRQKLGLENQAVWLAWNGDRIDVDNETTYQEKLAASRALLQQAISRLKVKGI